MHALAPQQSLTFILLIYQFAQIISSNSNTARIDLLNHLFNGYDKRLIPAYITGNTTLVTVQIFIIAIASISEASMDYKLTMLLRPRWNDERLAFNSTSGVDRLELDVSVMDKVWVPDVYIPSEKSADFHKVTVPNKLMHIYPNGDIQYSLRVTGTFVCPMNLLAFPFDKQYCKMELASYGYSANNLQLRWAESAVTTSDELELPQYELTKVSPYICDRPFYGILFTCIGVRFTFVRNYGYYMTQIFLPSILVVILSWVNFWIDPEAVPARISIGLLTVLTMTTMFSGARANLPRVSYTKAIDVWMACCLMFVFTALLEFALVNVLARIDRRRRKLNASDSSTKAETNENSNENHSETVETGNILTRIRCLGNLVKKGRARVVDRVSRYVFPLLFILFNFVYWIHYLVVFVSPNNTSSG